MMTGQSRQPLSANEPLPEPLDLPTSIRNVAGIIQHKVGQLPLSLNRFLGQFSRAEFVGGPAACLRTRKPHVVWCIDEPDLVAHLVPTGFQHDRCIKDRRPDVVPSQLVHLSFQPAADFRVSERFEMFQFQPSCVGPRKHGRRQRFAIDLAIG